MFKAIPRLAALHETLLNGYHVVKSAKGYSLRNAAGEILTYGAAGLWFEEYVLIGECKNIVWFDTNGHKGCMYDTLRHQFVTEPKFY